ncbi:MAG TPA: AAA family ATPase, partial [Clostridia bacterium]|nr:AAA family ATPase [Clostridia bacterium]
MTIILGYTLTETIYKNLYSKACLAVRENETRPVLLRLPIGGNEKDFSANQLRQELRAVQKHEFPARANYREIFLSNGGFLLETDTYGFVPISKLFTGKGFKPELFFAAAIDITKNLEILHHHKKVLGCLRAEAILLEPRQKKVLFTEFSGLVSLKTPGIPNMSGKSPTEDLTGIMYLSPEQNGCLNKPVDCRSDLYSLGVLFYRMLTGVLPYRGNSVLELYHALTAGTFIPPHRANPKVPEALSRIVLRLLERDPDSRYQSAYGLRKDLEKCLEYWERENRIPRFTLAMHDVKTTSRAVEGFYGRQYELQIMQQKLKNAACGSAGILFLEGEAGIGKTALTRHFEKKSREDGALFASGKSSPIKNGLPYKPLAEAFQQLFQWVMGGSEEEVARWKEEFRKRSPVLFLLTGIMPYLEYFLGNNTAPGDLGDNDIEERFFSAFYSLISIFTAGKGPLVLFLDDLQWADRGTLSIIEALFTRFKIKNLLLIGAYRNEEVSEGHPLKNVMESIKDSGTNITTLRLKPLALEDLIRMTADNLECDSKEAVPLARFIFEKTQGNPLFSKEVIQSMLKENLIIFGPGGGWNWDLEKLKEANLSDDIIVFLEQRIKLLPSSTLSLLKYAACIGNPFSIDMLAKVTNKSPSETEEKLNLCIMEGLIQREEDKSYSFIHDRIWQTVYLLIPNSQKPAFHYRLGSLLLQVLEETADAGVKDPALLFSAANQLNLGTEWIKNGNERLKAAELNLKAGEKAKKSAAFTTALDYLRSGLGLLNEMAWEDCYRLAFGLNSAYLECLYLCGYYERADSIYDTLMERVKDRMDRVRLRTLKILFYTKKNFSRETIRIALEGLRELGLIIPEKPSMLNITSQLLKVSIMLGRVGIQNIATLPDADDTEKKAAMDLLIALGPSAYNLDSTLLMAISLKICELSLRYGNFSNSASAYITLAMVFTVQFKFYRWGKGLADTALELAEKSRSDSVKTTVNFIYGAFCGPWHNHAKGSLGYLERAKEYGFASSDLMYAGFAMTFEVINLHFTGITFSVLLERINKSLGYATRIKDPYYAYTLTVYKQFIRSLRGLTPEPGSFGNKTLRDEDFVTSLGGVMVRERDKFDYYLMKGEACYILGQYDRAAAMLEQADRLSKLYFGEVYLSDLDLYYCLTQIARFKQLGLGERMKKWLKLHKRRRRLRNWAQHCPENFLHKSLLVEAELARVRGKHGRSFSLYQQAIGCAKKNGFLQDYAIGCECAANYFLSRGFGDLAGKYMTDALEGYRDWGAAAKVWQLKESHSMLLDRAYIDDTAATQETETMVEETREFTKMVDVESIVRAAEVLSGEIVLEELLKKM